MKIAIDAGPLKNGHSVRGIGVHTRELLMALENERRKQKSKNIKIEAVDFSKRDLKKYDILHYQFFNPFFLTIPKEKVTKTVVTIHDLIPIIYPDHYPPGVKGQWRFLLQKIFLKNVDVIITISETSKKDICRFLGVKPNKVHVVHLAQRKIFKPITDNGLLELVKKKYNLPDEFVLYVGDINYNKNIPTLVEACKLANVPLVICGKQALEIEDKGITIYSLKGPRDWVRYLFGRPHPEIAHYQEVLDKVKSYKKIVRLGFVNDEDLVAIYNLASVYVQASFYEGFGLPILEAQASGCPVIASKNQAHIEIAGNSVLFADTNNPKSFAQKIRKVIGNRKVKEEVIKEGLRNSNKYSWQKTAKETLRIYQSL